MREFSRDKTNSVLVATGKILRAIDEAGLEKEDLEALLEALHEWSAACLRLKCGLSEIADVNKDTDAKPE